MTALQAPKGVQQLQGPDFFGPYPVKANKKIYDGALVAKASTGAYSEPANNALGTAMIICGVAAPFDNVSVVENGQATTYGSDPRLVVDSTGLSDGDVTVMCKAGVFRFKNKAGDLVTNLMINENCYVEDDQTVRATAAGTTAAGKVVQIADDGSGDVYVEVVGYGMAV